MHMRVDKRMHMRVGMRMHMALDMRMHMGVGTKGSKLVYVYSKCVLEFDRAGKAEWGNSECCEVIRALGL